MTQDSTTNELDVSGKDDSGVSNPRHGKGHVFISIDNVQNTGLDQKVTYIQAYMKFMYWTGVCPFNPLKSNKTGPTTTLCDWVLNFLPKVSKYIL